MSFFFLVNFLLPYTNEWVFSTPSLLPHQSTSQVMAFEGQAVILRQSLCFCSRFAVERPTTAFYIHLVFLFGWSRLSQAFPESILPSRTVPKRSARSPGHRTLNDVTPTLLGQFLCPGSDCLFLRSLFFSLPPQNQLYIS